MLIINDRLYSLYCRTRMVGACTVLYSLRLRRKDAIKGLKRKKYTNLARFEFVVKDFTENVIIKFIRMKRIFWRPETLPVGSYTCVVSIREHRTLKVIRWSLLNTRRSAFAQPMGQFPFLINEINSHKYTVVFVRDTRESTCGSRG